MATKIKVSSLPSELQNLLEADRKKRGGMTEQERADELSNYLNKRKSAGTLPSGTLTNEEKMDYTKRDSDKARNRALAEMAATAEENELVRKKSDSALSSPSMGKVQRGDGSQTTDFRPGETRRGNKPEASLLEKIQYVQARGADAFASANENLNILGEAIAAGINSGIESAKNRDTLGVVLSSAAKGAADSLDKSAEENVNERARQVIDSKYAHVVNSKGASVAADLVSSANQMLPAVMLPGAAGTALLAATNFPESYVSARNNGADQKQAATYGAVNAAINSIGERLIGGIASKGTGLAGKAANAISRGASSRLAANAMNSIAKSPLAKTALSAVAKSAGEGAEEVVQSLLSTAAERATYNPEAKVDAKELAYEGLLGGLMGGAFQAASLPATYQAYRSDYDTVNNFSLAGEAVANESDVEIIRNVGESVVKGADEILSDKSADADQKQRAQYIKSGVEAVMKKLDESSADIIKGNQQKYAALEKLVSSDRSNVVENLAMLVRDVSGATSGNKDAINKTVDFVRGEIQNANNILATSSDPNARQEAAVNLQNYKDVDRTLRTFRKQINKALADLPAQSNAEMQVPAQTEPKAQVQTENVTETASAPEPTKPRQTVTKSVLKGYGVDTEVPASKFPEYLLNQLQTGKITQEEADALDAEYEAKYPKKAAETKLNAATAAYQKGEISEAQYDAQYSQYETELKDIDSRMSSETFPVRLRPVYEEVVQPVSEVETQTEQTVDNNANAADTTSVNAGEGSAPVRENAADIAGDEAQTAEEVAERLAEEGYSFRDIRDQINAYRAENTAESNAAADRLEEADRILVKKNRANVQKVANAYAPILKRFGINGVVVEDMPVGRNAAFDRKTNTIHLSSRISGSGAVGRFIVHEFTHRGTKIDMSLADSIVSAMESRKGGRGYISEAVIRDAYADQLSGLSAEEADSIVREERAAHFMERIMEDVNVLDEFRDDRTFLRKILDAIRDFFARNNPDKQEQIRLRRIEEKINDLLKAANVDAEVETGGGQQTDSDLTPGKDGVVYSDSGEPVADSTTDGTIRLSLSTYEAEGREVLRKYLNKSVSSGRLTAEEAREMQDSLEDIYRVCSEFKDKYAPFSAWSDAEVVRDTHGRPVFSVVTPNGEYKMNLDFSLVCKKRRTLDAVFNEMAQRGIIDEFELGQKSVVKINEIIRKHGFETACALCFVDAKRFRQASMADQFVSLYNELVESLVPEDQKGSIGYFNFSGNTSRGAVENGIDTWGSGELDFSHLDYVMKNYAKGTVEHKSAQYIKGHPEARKLLQRGDFMSSAGFDAVKSQNATIMKLYNSKKGTGGPKAAFGDVQYLSEVIKKAKGWTPAKAYAVGGVRVQSFSDYVPRMVFDYAQMIHDLAATGLPAHAYTKEVLFAKQFGLTGVKINMSLIPAVVDGGIAPGLDADGNYVWAGESFNYDEAVEIQNADGYTENCGTICVGVSKEHILKLLDDPNIRMVIPYHKSGLNPIVAHMNKIDSFVDYTGSQNTLDENGKKLSKDFDFNKVLREVGDPQKAVDRYLAWVDEHGYTAKFNEFRGHPNYYKLLEDFTLYDMDGNYVPQRAVKAVFPQDGDTFGSMRDLIESGLQEDAVIEGRRDSELGEIVDEIEQTLPKTEAEIEETAVEQAEGDVERDIRESRELDEEYMSAVESGDTEKAQKMVDEAAKKAGYTVTAYHGTPTGGFTKFDSARIGSNTGVGRGRFSFTSDKSVADIYSGKDNKAARASELVSSLNKMFRKYDSEELRMLLIDDTDIPVVWDSDIIIAEGANDHGYIDFDYDWEDNDPELYADYKEAKEAEKLAEFEGTRRYLIDTLMDYRKGADSSLDEFFDEALTMLKTLSPERTPMTYSVYLKAPTAEFEADTKNYNSVAWDAAYSDADVAVIHLDNGEDRYFVNNPASIKSSDAVVYDDDGNVVPISERFNDDNSDIRYSRDLETPEQKHIRRLEEQNEYLKKQYQSQTAFGWAKTVSPAQRKQFAGTIAADIPGVSADEVSAAIKPVYDLFEKPKRGAKDTPEVRLAEARKLAQEAAERLVDGAIETEINPMYEQYNDLRNFLRTTPIKRTISAEEFGGAEAYSKWRDGNRGLLRVSTNPDARGIDSVYKEISVQYPEFFPEDITDMAEMLRRMGDVAVLLKTEAGNKTVKVNPLEDVRDSFVQDVANRILYGFDQLAKITPAAKYEYGGKVNERNVQRAYAEGMSSAAAREAQAYDSGLKEGRKQNDLEVQAAHQREDIQYQIFQRDFNQAVNDFNREIERQNKRIETLQKRIETRGQREQLAMAKKVVYGRLNRLNTMLTKPNRSKHIPQNLRAPIARLLEAVGTTYLPNGKTVQSGAMQDIQEKEYARFESESVRVVDEIATIIGANKTSENNAVSQQYLDKLTENVLRLKEMHAEMNPNSPDDVVLPPDLMSTKKIEYVKQLNRILAMAENYIKDSNTVFLAGKATSAKDFSERMISDLRGKTVPNESNRLRKFFHDVGYEFVSADLFFEMVGESGNDIMRQYRKAQTTQAKCEEEYAQYIFGKTGGKYSTNKAGFNGDLIDISANGKKLKVTRAQLMQLYMTWKRPAGRRHLRTGGAIFVNEAGVELKENTILINNATYDELISHLSDEDKRIADALGSFMVRRCAEWGNDASMQMYGYRMFEDPHYFPMDVSNNVLPANWDSMDEFYRLENAGMTKSIKENASAPLRMTDIFDVADFHVRTMAAYAAYAPVSNDMQRILNMPGVNEAVNVGMGKKGAKYLETLVKTIASNKVRTGDMSDAARPLQFFMNAYKRQAVSFNISTALKQPLSIVRALNDIDAKYILKVPASMMGKEYARAYNAMIENSGVAKMKMLGYSDTGFGKSLRQIYDTGYINESGIIRGSAAGTKAGRIAVKTYDKITDAGMWAAGKMDEATWVRLWRACELEVSDRHKGLSAKEKTAKVAERFNEIIGRSQVVDTVLDTSPLMRNNAMAILTPFMNEPTKALATIITAADAYKDGKAGSKKKLVKAIGLVALNNLLLEPIVSALMTMWRDEEDDTENIADFSKKFLKLYAGVDLDGDTSVASVMTSNAVSGVLGSVPILQIFYNTFSDSMQNYSNEKIDTAALSNLIRDTKNLIVNSRKEAVDRVETNYKLFSDFLGSAAAAIGIPLPTLRRQASAMVRTALEHTDSYDLQWRYAKILYNLENSSARTQKQFYNILAAAYKANDVADYQYMLNDLKNTQTGKNTIGISWNKMKKYIEDRGGKYEIGSDLWLVGVQAEFNLSSFNPAMKVESMLGKIYKSAISEGVKNPERALPSTPALYSYNKVDENGNDVLDKNGDPVKVEMTLAEYEGFIADVGKLSYNILLALQGQGQFKNLSAEEQVYCLDKAYDFAARYYRSKFNPNYDLSAGGKWMAEVAKGNLDTTKISRAILNAERNRK